MKTFTLLRGTSIKLTLLLTIKIFLFRSENRIQYKLNLENMVLLPIYEQFYYNKCTIFCFFLAEESNSQYGLDTD